MLINVLGPISSYRPLVMEIDCDDYERPNSLYINSVVYAYRPYNYSMRSRNDYPFYEAVTSYTGEVRLHG